MDAATESVAMRPTREPPAFGPRAGAPEEHDRRKRGVVRRAKERDRGRPVPKSRKKSDSAIAARGTIHARRRGRRAPE
jgi:hypothetical protein